VELCLARRLVGTRTPPEVPPLLACLFVPAGDELVHQRMDDELPAKVRVSEVSRRGPDGRRDRGRSDPLATGQVREVRARNNRRSRILFTSWPLYRQGPRFPGGAGSPAAGVSEKASPRPGRPRDPGRGGATGEELVVAGPSLLAPFGVGPAEPLLCLVTVRIQK
jgi:hypothetical protein